MELSKISAKGQITIPMEIRKFLGLETGDKVVFVKKDNNIVMLNSNRIAFEEFQKDMTDATKDTDIKSEQDVVDLVNQVRKDIYEEKYDRNV